MTLFNEGDTAAVMSTTAAAAGLPAAPAYLLRDLWSKKLTVTVGAISVLVQPHQTVMYRISAPLSRR